MSRVQVQPVFVDRKTAAALMMVSIPTFDAWLRAGFIPSPHIDRGQIVRWHWPSLEDRLAHIEPETAHSDPALERIANVFGNRKKGGRRAAA